MMILAIDFTPGREIRHRSIAKLFTIKMLTFVTAGRRIAHATHDEVSLAEHESDDQDCARGGRIHGRTQQRPGLVCGHISLSIARHAASHPNYSIRKDPAPCTRAHLRVFSRVGAAGIAEMR